MSLYSTSFNCKGKIIASREDALELLTESTNKHDFEFLRIELDRIENLFNSYVFICKDCQCEFSVHTEGMMSNCVIISHGSFYHSCEEIIMDKACR